MATIATVDNALNTAKTASNLTNKYVVSPISGLGFAGFVFDVEDEDKVELTSDVTDHYVEDNSTIQDHIGIKPVKVTLKRFVGELTDKNASDLKSRAVALTSRLTVINSYLPQLTDGVQQIKNITQQKNLTTKKVFDTAAGDGVDLFKTFKSINPPATKQAKAFNFISALQQARQLVSLQTPYNFYSNMAIESVVAIQSGTSKYISDFTLTLKEIRTAETQFVAFDKQKYQGRAAGQSAEVENKGKAQGEVKPLQSLLIKGRNLLLNR